MIHIYYGLFTIEFRITAFRGVAQFRITRSHITTTVLYLYCTCLYLVLNKLMDFRTKQLRRLADENLETEQITTLNLVGLGGGIGQNVIPAKTRASFDRRIRTTDFNFSDIQSLLDQTIAEATALGSTDHPVSIEFSLQSYETAETVAEISNVWCNVIQNACMEM